MPVTITPEAHAVQTKRTIRLLGMSLKSREARRHTGPMVPLSSQGMTSHDVSQTSAGRVGLHGAWSNQEGVCGRVTRVS